MKLGICSIQRNRGKWLAEWVIFHNLMGFENFYIYLHKCTDNSREVLIELQKRISIHCFEVNDDAFRPQLIAYEHAYQEFGHAVDWMAFIDGDEFLFPTANDNLIDALAEFNYEKISALAVYWQCFGSNGHVKDPDGLVIEDYTSRASLAFPTNRHVKSIVRGRQGVNCSTAGNAHLFNTIYGTFDELLRPIDKGLMEELSPSYKKFCINHYVCQSYEFFKTFKQKSGAADAGENLIRSEEWWKDMDRNEEKEEYILKFSNKLKEHLYEFHKFQRIHQLGLTASTTN
jgi:hypothetical protein